MLSHTHDALELKHGDGIELWSFGTHRYESSHMIQWHMYIVYDVRLDVHVPSAIKTTAYYHVLYCRTSVSNPRVVYNACGTGYIS